jgi:hypothetical protein
MNPRKAIVVTLAMLFVSLAGAEDFKTVSGKIYKDATVSHVEADGIVLRTKSGISKVYFVELPKDVQQRFHYGSPVPTAKAITQRGNQAASANQVTSYVPDGTTFADKFAARVQNKLDERESILQGKHTPGPAELAIIREFNWHWVYLAVIAVVAGVLFATVWRRFR